MNNKTRYPIFFALALLFIALIGFQSNALAKHRHKHDCCNSCQVTFHPVCCPAPQPVCCPAPKPVCCPAPEPVCCPAPVVYVPPPPPPPPPEPVCCPEPKPVCCPAPVIFVPPPQPICCPRCRS